MNDLWRGWLEDAITLAGGNRDCPLVASMFMPEHVPLLVLPLRPNEGTINGHHVTLFSNIPLVPIKILQRFASPADRAYSLGIAIICWKCRCSAPDSHKTFSRAGAQPTPY